MAIQTEAQDITQAQFFRALEEFILKFATPALVDDGRHVIPGYVDDQSLPPDGGDFVVYTPIQMERQGTTIEKWREDDKVSWAEYVQATIQIDCYSTSPVRAFQRVSTLEMIARSEAAVNHFNSLHMDCLYAENVRNLSAVLDSGKYVSRWSVELSVGFWKEAATPMEYFQTASVDVANVDVRFPPS